MSETWRTIPTIDLQDFPSQSKLFRSACEEWGCFRIVNHNVSTKLLSEMKEVARFLLDLPSEIKQRNTDVVFGKGYMAPSKVNPLYEALGLYNIASSQTVHDFCSQMGASTYQTEIIENYAAAIHELTMKLTQKLAESLGLIGKGNMFQDWPCKCRISKYHFAPETVGSQGVQLHTDSGLLTILQDDETVGGLEVMDKCGVFVAADPMPGTLFVNLGDTAKVWSNGRFHNVKHRVQCKEGTIRLSIASILMGPKEATVEVPEEFVDSERPRLYLPFTYEDYMKLRISKNLQTGEALELMRCNS